MAASRKVEQSQVIVDRPDQWLVLFLFRAEKVADDLVSEMRREIEKLAGPGISVRVEQRDRLEKTESGKWAPVIVRCWGESPYISRS
jgi:hypothetical protein